MRRILFLLMPIILAVACSDDDHIPVGSVIIYGIGDDTETTIYGELVMPRREISPGVYSRPYNFPFRYKNFKEDIRGLGEPPEGAFYSDGIVPGEYQIYLYLDRPNSSERLRVGEVVIVDGETHWININDFL